MVASVMLVFMVDGFRRFDGAGVKDLDRGSVKVPGWVQEVVDGGVVDERFREFFRGKASGFQKREIFLRVLESGIGKVSAAREFVGWSQQAYSQNRSRWPAFAAYVDAVLAVSGREGLPDSREGWRGRFVEFREHFFGMTSPFFHAQVAAVVDSGRVKGGDILMCLFPPEHGKTTFAEDYCSYRLALDPDFTICVGSERQDMSKKILKRVQQRMEISGPVPDYVRYFGPFEPQKGRNANRQPWGAEAFDVFKKGSFDDREFSMQALGIGSGIAGTRTQMLLVDDVMSLRNFNQAASVLETFRQDWLSRPGTKGFTWINGTRVGEGDVYERLLDEGLVDHLIIFPAINDDGEYLWPERYSPEEYERMRRNVGEEAWWRNYMQKPRAAGASTFDENSIDSSLRPGLSVNSEPFMGAPIYVGLDPAIGGVTAICVLQHIVDDLGRNYVRVLDSRAEPGFTRYEQIWALLESVIMQWHSLGHQVTDVVIEANSFQKGMILDDRLLELQSKWGVRVRGHNTGKNKYDENHGIPQIPLSMGRGLVEIPWAEDHLTRARMEPLIAELRSWRPKASGKSLRQDRLMAFWFCWILWKERQTNILPGAGSQDWSFNNSYESMGKSYLEWRQAF